MKKGIILLTIFFSVFVKAQSGPILSCGSTEECHEAGLGMSHVVILLGALMGPHYLLNRLTLEEDVSYAQIGASKETIKFEIKMASPLVKREPGLLVTKLDLQKFILTDKYSISRFLFGIGYGFKFNLSELLELKTNLLADITAYDIKSRVAGGPELNTQLRYYYNDKIKPIFGLQVLAQPTMSYDIYLGLNLKSYNIEIHHQSESIIKAQYSYLSCALLF